MVKVALVVLALVLPVQVRAQTAADSAAIRATALDYIDGFYTGDGPRMERALHPELAKRIVNRNPNNGRSILDQMSAMTLVLKTRANAGAEVPVAQRRSDVRILDIFGNTASVRVDASNWVDYLHVAKWNGRWVIINVLWENRPS